MSRKQPNPKPPKGYQPDAPTCPPNPPTGGSGVPELCKHAPGPWVANGSDIRDNAGQTVAWVESCIGYEKDRDNAKLIEAAPEMYDILEWIYATYYHASKKQRADKIIKIGELLKKVNQ